MSTHGQRLIRSLQTLRDALRDGKMDTLPTSRVRVVKTPRGEIVSRVRQAPLTSKAS